MGQFEILEILEKNKKKMSVKEIIKEYKKTDKCASNINSVLVRLVRGGMIKREKFLNIDNGGKGKRIYKYWVDNG